MSLIQPTTIYKPEIDGDQRIEVVQTTARPAMFPKWQECWTVMSVKLADFTPLGNIGWEATPEGDRQWYWFAGADRGWGKAASGNEAAMRVVMAQGAVV